MTSRTAALGSGGWFLFTLMAFMFSIIMGMTVTWINVGSRSIANSIHEMQCQTEAARVHIAKLEVERDSLLSPLHPRQDRRAPGHEHGRPRPDPQNRSIPQKIAYAA